VLVTNLGQDPLGPLGQGHWWVRSEQDLPGRARQLETGSRYARGEPAGLAAALGGFDIAAAAFPVDPQAAANPVFLQAQGQQLLGDDVPSAGRRK
jgi:hypothetical protein